jgi:penicillin-binding protein 1A
MTEALADLPPTPFRIPQGVTLVSINPRTGDVVSSGTPGAILEPFKPGSEPGLNSARYNEYGPGGYTADVTSNPDTLDVQIGSGTGGLY